MSDTDKTVYVHGPCGLRNADCQCPDGPGQSMAARVAALEAQVAELSTKLVDVAAKLARLDTAGGP